MTTTATTATASPVDRSAGDGENGTGLLHRTCRACNPDAVTAPVGTVLVRWCGLRLPRVDTRVVFTTGVPADACTVCAHLTHCTVCGHPRPATR